MIKGKKYDQGKPRFDLIVPEFTYTLASIMAMGAEKYDANNWQQVDDFEARYTAALHRHVNAWQQGEQNDEESGRHHLAHAACNLMFLFWNEEVIHENPNVQRHQSEYPEIDKGPSPPYTNCDALNNGQKYKALRTVLEELISVLNKGRTHEPARACLIHFLDRRGFTQLAGTVDPSPDE